MKILFLLFSIYCQAILRQKVSLHSQGSMNKLQGRKLPIQAQKDFYLKPTLNQGYFVNEDSQNIKVLLTDGVVNCVGIAIIGNDQNGKKSAFVAHLDTSLRDDKFEDLVQQFLDTSIALFSNQPVPQVGITSEHQQQGLLYPKVKAYLQQLKQENKISYVDDNDLQSSVGEIGVNIIQQIILYGQDAKGLRQNLEEYIPFFQASANASVEILGADLKLLKNYDTADGCSVNTKNDLNLCTINYENEYNYDQQSFKQFISEQDEVDIIFKYKLRYNNLQEILDSQPYKNGVLNIKDVEIKFSDNSSEKVMKLDKVQEIVQQKQQLNVKEIIVQVQNYATFYEDDDIDQYFENEFENNLKLVQQTLNEKISDLEPMQFQIQRLEEGVTLFYTLQIENEQYKLQYKKFLQG